MNQDRIAELRLMEKHLKAGGQMVGACLGECLDHIAQLEVRESQRAAERLPKDGDELQAILNKAYRKGNDDAHAAHAVMDGAQLEAQRGEFSHVEASARYKALGLPDGVQMHAIFLEGWNGGVQQRGGAVVVPELTEDDLRAELRTWMAQPIEVRGPAWPGHGQYEKGFKKGFSLAISRIQPVPADRVLKPGQCAIGIYEMQMLRDFAARRMSQREHDRLEACRDAHEAELRSAKGEATP